MYKRQGPGHGLKQRSAAAGLKQETGSNKSSILRRGRAQARDGEPIQSSAAAGLKQEIASNKSTSEGAGLKQGMAKNKSNKRRMNLSGS